LNCALATFYVDAVVLNVVTSIAYFNVYFSQYDNMTKDTTEAREKGVVKLFCSYVDVDTHRCFSLHFLGALNC